MQAPAASRPLPSCRMQLARSLPLTPLATVTGWPRALRGGGSCGPHGNYLGAGVARAGHQGQAVSLGRRRRGRAATLVAMETVSPASGAVGLLRS